MNSTSRSLAFPKDRTAVCLHGRTAGYPYDFHGRFKREGAVLADTDNPGWRIIAEARGTVVVPPGTITLLEILPDAARDLSFLQSIKSEDLDGLWLGNTFVNDDGLDHIAHLIGLEWLDIQNNGAITDGGLTRLHARTALRHLGLYWTRISDTGLDNLPDLSHLTYLDIWGCRVSSEAPIRFENRHPDCRIRTE